MSASSAHEVAEARVATYRLLARLALSEVDARLARSLADLPVFGPALADSGGEGALPALRTDFTSAFLMNVHPYESVYLDESGLLNAPTSAAVLEHFREHGFEPDALPRAGAPDHLGLELEFMAFLAGRTAAAERIGNATVAASLRADQLHFLEHHLVRWAPLFGASLAEVAATPFYRAFGQVVERFVLEDFQALASLA